VYRYSYKELSDIIHPHPPQSESSPPAPTAAPSSSSSNATTSGSGAFDALFETLVSVIDVLRQYEEDEDTIHEVKEALEQEISEYGCNGIIHNDILQRLQTAKQTGRRNRYSHSTSVGAGNGNGNCSMGSCCDAMSSVGVRDLLKMHIKVS
jgi:hypothetical protein